jgi:hypothetical protein
MMGIIKRLATIVAPTLAPLAFVTLISPGVSNAAECGQGTVYDPASDSCAVAEPAPPPAPAAPAASVER